MATDQGEESQFQDRIEQASDIGHGSALPQSGSRKRTQACERCWKRKQKCDKLLPACKSCADLGIECVARSQHFDLTAEDPGLTHATVNGYINSLKRRVAELEHDVQVSENKRRRTPRAQADWADGISPASGASQVSPEASRASAPTAREERVPSEEGSSVMDTMSAIGYLSNKAMAEPQTQTNGTPHKLAVSGLISAALAVDGHNPSRASPSQPSLVFSNHLIPLTRETTLAHVHRFLDWCVFIPHLDQDCLLKQYDDVVSQTQLENAFALGSTHFNVYMAIATGIMMSSDANRHSALALSLHAAAIKISPLVSRSQDPFKSIHAMILLIVYAMFCPTGGSAWHLTGVAMTNAIAMGLHKGSASKYGNGTHSIYRIKWLFWSLYLLDRSLASTMGRPFCIKDEDISILVPQEEEVDEESFSDEAKGKLVFSRHLILHAQLISSIRSNSEANSLFSYSNLCFWREFPPPLPSQSSKYLQICLDVLACRALILVISSADQVHAATETLSGTLLDIAQDALESCKRLIDRFYDSSSQIHISGSYLDAYDLFAAAVVYIYLLQRLGSAEEQRLAETFQVVNKASIVLTQLSSRFSALGDFQRFLFMISSEIMKGPGASTLVKQKQWEVMSVGIPRYLRRFCEAGT